MNTCRMELFPGVWLTAVQTPKFKSSFWSAQFLTPLREEQASLNALVPKVLRQGTQRYPDLAAWSRALDERYGGAVEPMIRKRGEAQCVGFAASFLNDRLAPEPIDLVGEGAELLGELFFHPLTEGKGFPAATVEGEKKNLIDQLTGEINDKVHYANQRAIQLMCEGEGYGLNRLGTVESAQAAQPETVYEAYEALLSSAPMELYYCGWAEPEQVAEALRRAFAPLPLSQARTKVVQTAPAAGGQVRRFTDHLEVNQGKLVLGFRSGVNLTHPDYPAFLVFNALYGGTTNSRLFLHVREKRSLCYYASSMVDKLKGIMLVASGVDQTQFQAAEDEILAQLESVRQGELTEEELDTARRYLVSSFRTRLDDQGQLEDFWLTQNAGGVSEGPEELAARIEAVTPEQVTELARQMELDVVYRMEGRT